ncbi:MAG TPA: WbqC family protein [Bacteroidia bacterium]|jgi:hypothetical protein|nr:WbqC family protein [Bacteroidia bacterium]
MKKLFIIQTNYIPWKGYFDAINTVDEVVYYDTMQYTKNDWRNRNKIKTHQGTQWLTIPIDVKGKMHQRICDATVSDKYLDWRKGHWNALQINYSKSAHFKTYYSEFENIYKNDNETNLSKINYSFISLINSILGIKTPVRWSSEFELSGDKTEKIINLCLQTNTTEYFSGPSAKSYLDNSLFENAGIKLSFLDYSNYPEYNQLYGEFIHEVSILDLIFNEGPNARKFMKSFS